MIGRDSELARLEDALLAALHGQSRVVVLSGEAGVGKSRLLAELGRRAEAVGCTVVAGECSEADLALPYLPFVEAIGNLLTTAKLDVARVRSILGTEVAPLTRLLPELGSADESLEPMSTPLDKLRLFEAIVALLRALSAGTGLVLMLEDVHWIDRSTQELVDYVIRRLAGTRTLTLVTHRSLELDRHHPMQPTMQRWRRAGISETITLQPLSEDGVAAMIAEIFDREDAPADFARSVRERSEGIPFAVEELLREAVVSGRISGTDGRWDPKAVATMPPPRALADSILVRVERLSPEQVETLRAASVLGRAFEFPTLIELSGTGEAAAMQALHASVAAQLLEEDPQHEDGYRFRHELIRDAIYNDMVLSQRRRVHSRAADVISATQHGSPAELAWHLIAAGRHEEAADACVAAAEDAMARLAPREACDLLERALAHVSDLHEQQVLLCRLGEAWRLAGDIALAQRYLEDGVTGLEAAGDAARAAHYRLSLGRCYWERSNWAAERSQYLRAIEVLESSGPSEDLANAYMRLSSFHSRQFEGSDAQRMAERAIEIAEMAGLPETALVARDWLGLSLCDQGRLDDGLAELQGAIEEARHQGLAIIEARIISHTLDVMQTYGRAADTAPLFERLRSLPEDPWRKVVTAYDNGWVSLWGADLVAAADSAESCLTLAERFGMEEPAAWGRALLCAARTEMGQFDAARELLPEVLPDMERQSLVENSWVRLRHQLSSGDVAAAGIETAALINLSWATAGTAASDAVVEALIATGDQAEAGRVLAALEREPRAAMHRGHLLRARGRVQLAAGHAAAASEAFLAAQGAFADAGYLLEELRTAVCLADAQGRLGDRTAADATLAIATKEMRARRARALLSAAARVATAQGLSSIPPEPDEAVSTAPAEASAIAQQDAVMRTGERLVSVLFADVRHFTAMTQQQSPMEMADRMAAFQRLALLAVERHHGLVDKFAGDSVMATFNASGGHIDHAQHAVDVALRLIESASAIGLPVGIAIAVGPAIVGRLAAGANVTVLGSITNLASRLQAEAKASQIMLSDEAYARVRNSLPSSVTHIEECELNLKGFDAPVHAYRLAVDRA